MKDQVKPHLQERGLRPLVRLQQPDVRPPVAHGSPEWRSDHKVVKQHCQYLFLISYLFGRKVVLLIIVFVPPWYYQFHL